MPRATTTELAQVQAVGVEAASDSPWTWLPDGIVAVLAAIASDVSNGITADYLDLGFYPVVLNSLFRLAPRGHLSARVRLDPAELLDLVP